MDDNASLAYFSAFALEQEIEGLKVITAGTCEEALVMVDEHKPSVFIADLKLPDGDGLELIAEVKGRFQKIIPILVSATSLPDERTDHLFGVLTKPYDPEALIDLTRRAIEHGDSWTGAPAGRHGRRETKPARAQYDFHHVQNRLSGLLAGIRALRLELYAVADDPSEVRRIVDEYSDRLSAMVKDAAETLKRKA